MRATWARADRRVFAVARSISTALRRDIDGVTQRSRWQEKAVEQEKIFGPFFAMMFLTIAVWIYMYVRRITFINLTKLSAEELAVPGALARHSPPAVSNPSDNLKNLFRGPGAVLRARALPVHHEARRSRLRGCRMDFRSLPRIAQHRALYLQSRDPAILSLPVFGSFSLVHHDSCGDRLDDRLSFVPRARSSRSRADEHKLTEAAVSARR